MSSGDYPEWRQTANAALDTGTTRRSSKPKPPTRAELIEQMRAEIRDMTRTAPTLRGRLLVLLDGIEAAKR